MPTPPSGARQALEKGRDLLHRIAADSGLVLFTAPRGALGEEVKAHAARAAMPHVVGRWIPGTLTNLPAVREGIRRLVKIETWEEDGTIRRYRPAERSQLIREKSRLAKRFDGLRVLDRPPAALVVAKPTPVSAAIGEARKIGRAVVLVVTTLGAPAPDSDIAIHVKDAEVADAVGHLADAVLEGAPATEPEDEGPGAAPVPARLRPKPGPRSGRARPEGA